MAERASFNVAELLGSSDRDLNDMLKAAVECYTENDFVKAEAILVGLLAFDPQHIRGLKLLGSTLLLLDRHREAEVMYQKAHELEPKDLYTLGALAEIKLRLLDVTGA